MSATTDQPLIAPIASDALGDDAGDSRPATAGVVGAPITLANANAMTHAGERFIADSSTVVVRLDMQNVEATSVAVAVALAWLAVASRAGKELCLSHLNADFSGVVEFSGINSMFAEHISNSATPVPH